jgi:L-malate glycosyltransferase
LLTIYRVNERFPIFSMLRLVGRIKPDVIHVHAPNFFSSNVIPIAKLKSIPIVATVHLGEVDPVGNPLFSFRKYALARFNKIIAVSNYTKSLALNAGVEGNKISVIYNSCDETFFCHGRNKDTIRKKHNIPVDTKLIIFVGQLIKRKGVSYLIDSLKILRNTLDGFLAIIVGQGEELQNLQSMVKEYGLMNHVEFRGNVTRTVLAELYSAADVFVLPSSSEGHSVALVEAMASGLPLVASDIEGSRVSIQDGVNGYLFETGNVEKLARKLALILADSNLQQKMSSNSSKIYLEKFSTKRLIDNYLEIYNSLINKR